MCNGYNIIASNRVRYIIKATSGSYLIMKIGSALRIINNTVYNIEKQEHTIEGAVQPICPIQFLNFIIMMIIHIKLMFKYLC